MLTKVVVTGLIYAVSGLVVGFVAHLVGFGPGGWETALAMAGVGAGISLGEQIRDRRRRRDGER